MITEFKNYSIPFSKDIDTNKESSDDFTLYFFKDRPIPKQVLLDHLPYTLVRYCDFQYELKSLRKGFISHKEI